MLPPQTLICEWSLGRNCRVDNRRGSRVVLLRYFPWSNPVAYQAPSSYVVPVNFGIFVIGNLYPVGLAFDALWTRNNLQLFDICIFSVEVFVYSAMGYEQTHGTADKRSVNHALGNRLVVKADVLFWLKVQAALIGSSILLGACMVSSSLLNFRLNREFAWVIHRHISAILSTRHKYLTCQVSPATFLTLHGLTLHRHY